MSGFLMAILEVLPKGKSPMGRQLVSHLLHSTAEAVRSSIKLLPLHFHFSYWAMVACSCRGIVKDRCGQWQPALRAAVHNGLPSGVNCWVRRIQTMEKVRSFSSLMETSCKVNSVNGGTAIIYMAKCVNKGTVFYCQIRTLSQRC